MAILFTLRGFARNLLRESRRKNIFSILVLSEIFGLEYEPRTHAYYADVLPT